MSILNNNDETQQIIIIKKINSKHHKINNQHKLLKVNHKFSSTDKTNNNQETPQHNIFIPYYLYSTFTVEIQYDIPRVQLDTREVLLCKYCESHAIINLEYAVISH